MSKAVWTYRDLLDQSTVMAKALHGAGLGPNDVVSVIAENRHEFLAATFGALCLNAAVAPVNVTYTERKLFLRNPIQIPSSKLSIRLRNRFMTDNSLLPPQVNLITH